MIQKKENDKILYGYINKTGKTIITCEYYAALPFENEYAGVIKFSKKEKAGGHNYLIYDEILIDKNGNEIVTIYKKTRS